MYLPQFTVVLRLANTAGISRKRRSIYEYPVENKTWAYLEDDIPNLANQTVVFVIVDDINDNAPVFVNTKQAVGYPNREIALEILPPYVTTVEVKSERQRRL